METKILGLLAETFIHPGGEFGASAVDLPVAREAGTNYPYIAGSGLKGALKDKAREPLKGELTDDQKKGLDERVKRLLGETDNAGSVLVSDARLLLLPIRSLSGAYKWVTCPLILERLYRDLTRACGKREWSIPAVAPKKALGQGTGPFMLEERRFEFADVVADSLRTALKTFFAHQSAAGRVDDQLVVLNDADFNWFALYGLSVQARNVLDEKKMSGNLWYEEALPPDTVMYALIGERETGAAAKVANMFMPDPARPASNPYLHAGGNETVGQGWFAVKML